MKEFVLFLLILSDTSCLYIYLKIQLLFFPVTINLNNVNVEFHVWNSVYLKHFFKSPVLKSAPELDHGWRIGIG